MSIKSRAAGPLKAAVKVTSMWLCCDCVTACVWPNWSGNTVACHAGAPAAVDCGKTCRFGAKRENTMGEQGEEVANEEDDIQLPLPSTADRGTRRSHSPLMEASSPSLSEVLIHKEVSTLKCILMNGS